MPKIVELFASNKLTELSKKFFLFKKVQLIQYRFNNFVCVVYTKMSRIYPEFSCYFGVSDFLCETFNFE